MDAHKQTAASQRKTCDSHLFQLDIINLISRLRCHLDLQPAANATGRLVIARYVPSDTGDFLSSFRSAGAFALINGGVTPLASVTTVGAVLRFPNGINRACHSRFLLDISPVSLVIFFNTTGSVTSVCFQRKCRFPCFPGSPDQRRLGASRRLLRLLTLDW